MATAKLGSALRGSMGCPPKEGPVSLRVDFDFPTLGTSIDADLSPVHNRGDMTSVQSIYVDNSQNTSILTITANGTNQRIVVPPQSQGYIPILVIDPPTFNFSTVGAFVVPVQFLNYYMPPFIWSAVSVKGT